MFTFIKTVVSKIPKIIPNIFVRKANTVDASVPTINIINKSTLLKDSDFQLMVEACRIQLMQHVAPMWLRGTWNIVVNQPENVGYPIVVLDNPDQAGILGYHTQSPEGKVWGRVFVKPIKDAKGNMLTGSLSVSAVLSHEVIEAYCDPNVNLWADRNNGTMIAYEVCDAVENDSYDIITSNGDKVSVSNFVLPTWFDTQAAIDAKFDFMAKLTKPFTMSRGGYIIVMNTASGKITNIFGTVEAEVAHGIRQVPHPASRSARKSALKS